MFVKRGTFTHLHFCSERASFTKEITTGPRACELHCVFVHVPNQHFWPWDTQHSNMVFGICFPRACPGALLFKSQSSSNHLHTGSSVSSSGWCWLVLHPEAGAFIHSGSGGPSQQCHCCLRTLHFRLLHVSVNCCLTV